MILVTGGTGLVGSHLLMKLYHEGQSARVLSRQTTWPNHMDKVLDYYQIDPNSFKEKFQLYQGDVTDIVSLGGAFEGIKKVYHCAALVSFKQSDYYKMMDINVNGTSNVVNMCLDAQIGKLCYVSSTAAIGKKGNETIIVEDGEWVRELNSSNYAKSKFLSEREVWRGQEEGLDVVIANPCVVLGPGNWEESSAALFKQASKGLKFYTGGSNAFVDARDVGDCLYQLMESEIKGERFLVIGHNLTFKVLFDKLSVAFGHKKPSKQAPRWLSNIGWRVEGVLAWLTRRKPRITKETVASAYTNVSYSNEKIKSALNMDFRSIEDTVEHGLGFYKSN